MVAFQTAMIMMLVLLVLAVLDLIYQRYQFNRDIRMTKEDVKRELREHEGDPVIRGRRRAIQRRMSMQRMMMASSREPAV